MVWELENNMDKFVGPKKIKETKTLEEKTPANGEMLEVEYEDGTKEVLSKMMYGEIVSDKECDLTTLRDKRVRPVVATVLMTFREWGLKVGELSYMSALLTQSLEANQDEAQKELWLKWIPTLQSLDDVNMIVIDLILKEKGKREKREKEKPIISPFNN